MKATSTYRSQAMSRCTKRCVRLAFPRSWSSRSVPSVHASQLHSRPHATVYRLVRQIPGDRKLSQVVGRYHRPSVIASQTVSSGAGDGEPQQPQAKATHRVLYAPPSRVVSQIFNRVADPAGSVVVARDERSPAGRAGRVRQIRPELGPARTNFNKIWL